MCGVDTQSEVADAGKRWQMRQEGSGNPSRILGESLERCRRACAVYQYMRKTKKKIN